LFEDVLTLKLIVWPAFTLMSVANPSMLSSSNESQSLGGFPGSAFSFATVVGVDAPTFWARAPRLSPTAPALTAAPLRNERRANAPKGANPRSSSWPLWPSLPPILMSALLSLSRPSRATGRDLTGGLVLGDLAAHARPILGTVPEAALKTP
jgi:hypothetical protein